MEDSKNAVFSKRPTDCQMQNIGQENCGPSINLTGCVLHGEIQPSVLSANYSRRRRTATIHVYPITGIVLNITFTHLYALKVFLSNRNE